MGCGRNGFGAKITKHFFSKEFIVVVEDPENKNRFTGIWKDNMFKNTPSEKPDVKIETDKFITKGSVSISWELDFERFQMKKIYQK